MECRSQDVTRPMPLALKISPILLAFLAGLAGQHFKLLSKTHADKMLRLVVYVGLPALILASISRIELSYELSLLPLAASLTLLLTWPLATLAGHWLRLPRPTLGPFVIGPMVMNLAFVFPFVIAAWGAEGFALIALFDFGNGIIVLTLSYALACWYGAGRRHWSVVAQKIVTFPPFVALFAALLINLAALRVPVGALDVVHDIGSIIILLVPLALGVYFTPRVALPRAVALAVALRVGLGFLFGLLWVALFQLEGLLRAVVLIGCAAPVGFNALVFSAQHHLDKDFAASITSVSLLLGLFYLPLMLYLLG